MQQAPEREIHRWEFLTADRRSLAFSIFRAPSRGPIFNDDVAESSTFACFATKRIVGSRSAQDIFASFHGRLPGHKISCLVKCCNRWSCVLSTPFTEEGAPGYLTYQQHVGNRPKKSDRSGIYIVV